MQPDPTPAAPTTPEERFGPPNDWQPTCKCQPPCRLQQIAALDRGGLIESLVNAEEEVEMYRAAEAEARDTARREANVIDHDHVREQRYVGTCPDCRHNLTTPLGYCVPHAIDHAARREARCDCGICADHAAPTDAQWYDKGVQVGHRLAVPQALDVCRTLKRLADDTQRLFDHIDTQAAIEREKMMARDPLNQPRGIVGVSAQLWENMLRADLAEAINNARAALSACHRRRSDD